MVDYARSISDLKIRARLAARRSQNNWRQLTAGMEIEELWAQFKAEAEESSRLYKQDVDRLEIKGEAAWKQSFEIARTLFWSVLKRLSPARRIFLLVTIVLAFFSIVGVHFIFFTKEVEFAVAFTGLLILLALVLGDHVSMKRDIEIARDIQRWLVPRKPPDVPGTDVAFATRPAKTIGGDYYDAFRRASDGPLLLAVADVCGKSSPAAMLMATFQASLRTLAGGNGALSEVVKGLNRQACANNQNGQFTTAFLAELDPATGVLNYLCAGHNPPILRRANGSFARLQSENIPFGIEPKEDYKTGMVRLESDDLLVIFTDGVTEARNPDDEEFGEARLLSVVQSISGVKAALALSKIMQRLDEFVANAAPHDDITCLVVRRT